MVWDSTATLLYWPLDIRRKSETWNVDNVQLQRISYAYLGIIIMQCDASYVV